MWPRRPAFMTPLDGSFIRVHIAAKWPYPGLPEIRPAPMFELLCLARTLSKAVCMGFGKCGCGTESIFLPTASMLLSCELLGIPALRLWRTQSSCDKTRHHTWSQFKEPSTPACILLGGKNLRAINPLPNGLAPEPPDRLLGRGSETRSPLLYPSRKALCSSA